MSGKNICTKGTLSFSIEIVITCSFFSLETNRIYIEKKTMDRIDDDLIGKWKTKKKQQQQTTFVVNCICI